MLQRPSRIVSAVLATLALGVSIYLAVVHYTEPLALSCPSTGVINCAKVTTSSQSELLGFLPVSLAGAIFYLLMTALLWRAVISRDPTLDKYAALGALAGLGMVVYLVYVEAVELHAFCLWCTGVHVLTLALVISAAVTVLLPPADDQMLRG